MNKKKSMRKRLVRMPSSLTRQGVTSTWRSQDLLSGWDNVESIPGVWPQFLGQSFKTLGTSKMSEDVGNVFCYSS